MTQTITCAGPFGDVTRTRKQFVDEWQQRARELRCLADELSELDYFDTLITEVRRMAERDFDRLWNAQTKRQIANIYDVYGG